MPAIVPICRPSQWQLDSIASCGGMTMIPQRRVRGWCQSSLAEAWMPRRSDHHILLTTLPATRRDRAIALVVVGVSAVLFASAVPFATVPLAPVPAFIASYQSALVL